MSSTTTNVTSSSPPFFSEPTYVPLSPSDDDKSTQARDIVRYTSIVLAIILAIMLVIARIRYLRNRSRPLTSFFSFSPVFSSSRTPLSSPLASPPLTTCERSTTYPRTHGLPTHFVTPSSGSHPNNMLQISSEYPNAQGRFVLSMQHLYPTDLFPPVPPGVLPPHPPGETEKEQLPAYDPRKPPAYSENRVAHVSLGNPEPEPNHNPNSDSESNRDIERQ